jgi:hypothetical protein
MSVRKSDVPRILMNPKHECLRGFGEIARHLLDPLPRLKSGKRINDVRRGIILRVRIVPRSEQRQGNDDRDSAG